MITLQSGDAVCDVHPDIGGSIGRWAIGAQNMLRMADAATIAARDLLGMASFPLVPYSNRVGQARFRWQGEEIALAPNFAPEPHAIHGVGWHRPWSVEHADVDALDISLVHPGDGDWSWPFEARQQIRLAPDSLTIACSATNQAGSPVPLAFGHHPYFDADGATLVFDADRIWLSGPDSLPVEPVRPTGAFDFSAGRPVADRDVDHCYAGLGSRARIAWQGRAHALEICSEPPLPAAVVYVPRGGDAFCYEPVPHVNNALNMPTAAPAMPVVAAGDSFRVTLTFRAVPR